MKKIIAMFFSLTLFFGTVAPVFALVNEDPVPPGNEPTMEESVEPETEGLELEGVEPNGEVTSEENEPQEEVVAPASKKMVKLGAAPKNAPVSYKVYVEYAEITLSNIDRYIDGTTLTLTGDLTESDIIDAKPSSGWIIDDNNTNLSELVADCNEAHNGKSTSYDVTVYIKHIQDIKVKHWLWAPEKSGMTYDPDDHSGAVQCVKSEAYQSFPGQIFETSRYDTTSFSNGGGTYYGLQTHVDGYDDTGVWYLCAWNIQGGLSTRYPEDSYNIQDVNPAAPGIKNPVQKWTCVTTEGFTTILDYEYTYAPNVKVQYLERGTNKKLYADNTKYHIMIGSLTFASAPATEGHYLDGVECNKDCLEVGDYTDGRKTAKITNNEYHDQITITFWYKKIELPVTIHYVDEKGNQLNPDFTTTVKWGEGFTQNSPTIENYKFVKNEDATICVEAVCDTYEYTVVYEQNESDGPIINPSKPTKPTAPTTLVDYHYPITGDSNHIITYIIILVMALAAIYFVKKLK